MSGIRGQSGPRGGPRPCGRSVVGGRFWGRSCPQARPRPPGRINTRDELCFWFTPYEESRPRGRIKRDLFLVRSVRGVDVALFFSSLLSSLNREPTAQSIDQSSKSEVISVQKARSFSPSYSSSTCYQHWVKKRVFSLLNRARHPKQVDQSSMGEVWKGGFLSLSLESFLGRSCSTFEPLPGQAEVAPSALPLAYVAQVVPLLLEKPQAAGLDQAGAGQEGGAEEEECLYDCDEAEAAAQTRHRTVMPKKVRTFGLDKFPFAVCVKSDEDSAETFPGQKITFFFVAHRIQWPEQSSVHAGWGDRLERKLSGKHRYLCSVQWMAAEES